MLPFWSKNRSQIRDRVRSSLQGDFCCSLEKTDAEHAHTRTHTHTHTHAHTHTHTRTHTRTHAKTHKHTHTHTHPDPLKERVRWGWPLSIRGLALDMVGSIITPLTVSGG